MFLFDDIARDRFVVYIDCGHQTTSVAVVRGDGILSQFNIPIGGWHITKALEDKFSSKNITYAQADSLKKRITLNLNFGPEDVYTISSTDSVRADKLDFSAKESNKLVSDIIITLADSITKSLKLCSSEFPDYIPFHLSGGGISFIKGAPELLSKGLRRQVELIAPSLPRLEQHYNMSSVYALADTALRIAPSEQQKPKGIFSRLFRKK
jgi:cell division ATPase FtsA